MSQRKVIISLAPVQAGTPIDSRLLAEDVAKSRQKGAAMCHLHARLENGDLSPDTSFLTECFEQILDKGDIVVQASTGGVSDMNIEERCLPLDYGKVESASLNGGSTNLGEAIYRNSFEDIRYCANAAYSRGVVPEVEVFDIGMIHNIERLKEEEGTHFKEPILYNLVFGHQGGMQPTIESLAAFRSFVPSDALWGVTHFGRDNWTFLAAAIAMGATVVRIGFEDSHYLNEGNDAVENHELVGKLAEIIRTLGLEVATPDEARRIMGI